jgi:hypothetical protein
VRELGKGRGTLKHQEIGHRMARIAVAGALTCGIAAVAAGAGPAYAAGTTRYVGASAGRDTSCASPGYTSVQAAVNAASPGDTVYLCGTTPFKGQVIISKSITLTGSAGATISATNPWVASADALPPQFASDGLFVPQAIVLAWGQGVHATIKGLTIAGPLPSTTGGCAEQDFGILVIGGASAQISGDAVTNIRDANPSLFGCQFGVGIMIGREYWPTAADFGTDKVEDFAGSATITHTTVSGYQKGGIVVDGPKASAIVSDNTVTGVGPTTGIAQNGIQVSRGAAGKVLDNTVRGNQYTGGGAASSAGVLLYGGCGDPLVTGVSVTGNTLTNNDVGADLSNADPSCANPPSTKTADVVADNRISDSAVTNTSGASTTPLCGYQAGVSDFGNHDVITANHISGTGYLNHPNCTVAQPYVTYRIDTTGSLDPLVVFNF